MYDDLVRKIESFLKRDDIVSNDAIISAYDLKCAIFEEFREYNSIVFDRNNKNNYKINSNLVKEIKRKYKNSNIVNNVRMADISSSCLYGGMVLHFGFCLNDYVKISFEISKYSNMDEYYLEYIHGCDDSFYDKIDEFVILNKDVLDKQFLVLEKFHNRFYKYFNNGKDNRLTNFRYGFTSEYSIFKLKFDTLYGVRIYFVNEFDNYMYNSVWFGVENVKDIIDNNYDEILRKIPIDRLVLPDIFKCIINDEEVEDIKYIGNVRLKSKRGG